jgi:hypothetical protein
MPCVPGLRRLHRLQNALGTRALAATNWSVRGVRPPRRRKRADSHLPGFKHHAWTELGVGDALAGLERILKIVCFHALTSGDS